MKRLECARKIKKQKMTLLTTLDVLYLVLAIGFGAITIFLCLLLLRLSKTVGNLNKITEKVASITEALEEYVWQPIHFIKKTLEKMKKD